MSINIEAAIKHMYDLMAKKVTYSMTGSRTGTDGTADCSGAIYASLCKAGAVNDGWVRNTDSLHDWLVSYGFKLIATNKDWPMKRGDIVILGKRGSSGNAAGHVFMAVDGTNVIHCNYGANGVSVNNENQQPYEMGWYVYRLEGGGSTTNPNPSLDKVIDEVIAGKWGVDPERSQKLTAAGYNAQEVQNGVNAKLSGGSTSPNNSVDAVAKEVIAGKWGNDPERSVKLKAAGYDPVAVQKRVNELL